MDNWKRKELWHRRGEGYCVEVSHHTVPIDDSERMTTFASEGENRWCVYAYIYPEHPHFAKFEGDKMWQDAALALPLHGGPSMLRWHRDANCNPTSVQVGADYNHDGDSGYTHYDDAAEARLLEDMKFLASDQLQGRAAENPGLEMAAQFIANRFADLGLRTDFFDGKAFQECTI